MSLRVRWLLGNLPRISLMRLSARWSSFTSRAAIATCSMTSHTGQGCTTFQGEHFIDTLTPLKSIGYASHMHVMGARSTNSLLPAAAACIS